MPGIGRHQFTSWALRLPTLSNGAGWFAPAALFALSFGLHRQTLWGGFVWDDRPAVVGNRDVWTDSPWGNMWRHDFWGQQMAHAQSHKSFRPLTTLTYRLSNIVAQKLSEKGQDSHDAGGQHPLHHHTNSTETAEVVAKKEYVARGAGPERADAVGFHLFNVIVHAASCSFSVWLFRAIFAGEELPAAAASLLFTVHPVHVEAVAPMVGRADLLCGLLSVIALFLTITRIEGLEKDHWKKEKSREEELKAPMHPSGFSTSSKEGSNNSSSSSSSSSSLSSCSSCSTLSLSRRSTSTRNMIVSANKGRRDPTSSLTKHNVAKVRINMSQPKASFELSAKQSPYQCALVKTRAFQDGSRFVPQKDESSSPPSSSIAGSKTSWPTIGGEATTASGTEGAPACVGSSAARMAAGGDRSEDTIDDGNTRKESDGKAALPEPYPECALATMQDLLLLQAAVAAVDTGGSDEANSSPGADAACGEEEKPLATAAAGGANKEDRENKLKRNQGKDDRLKEEQQRREGRCSTLDSRFNTPRDKQTRSLHLSIDEKEVDKETRGLVRKASAFSSPLDINSSTEDATMVAGGERFRRKFEGVIAKDVKYSGPGVARYIAALFFAAGATLCKEVGITVFGLMAGGEIVRSFGHRKCRQQRQQQPQQQRGQRSRSPAAGGHEALREKGWLQRLRQRLTTGLPAGAVARMASAATCACTLLFLHVRLHEGARVRQWGVLENDISILPSRKERALSYAFTHAVYASKLLWPVKLCYDWGFSCIPHVTSFADPANLASLTLYASILVAAAFAIVRCDTAVMWGLALLVVPFLPASNAMFPVGAVVAERLLYLPSLGACVLAGCLLRCDSGSRSHDWPTSTPSPWSHSEHIAAAGNDATKHGKIPTFNEGGELLVPLEGEKKEDQKETDDKQSHPPLHIRNAAEDVPPVSEIENPAPPGEPSISFSSRLSTETTILPGCRSGRAPLFDQEEGEGGIVKLQTTVRLAFGSRRSARRTIVAVLLLSWAAFFGERTLRRCKDWNSERALFESALEVCPDGIKTLNNMGVSMLNVEEAGRAQVLLQRAVELHPHFGFAFFNLGVSLKITLDHVGAVSAFERSFEVEPWNTKVLVLLGEVYLELALTALETPPDEVRRRADVNPDSCDARHRIVGDGIYNDERHAARIRSSPPESLLASAEFYTDRALDAGSGLPLARLVKGHVLSLRGQHQLAAEFFQESIDISLHLLSRRSGTLALKAASSTENRTSVWAAAGSMEASDAIDLVSTYNRLGLALRDSGTDVNAAKEAFLAGLSVAPENLALLVNGGVVHQNAGDIPGAKALYLRALSLQPNSPELLSNMGWLEEQCGGGSRLSLETAAEMYDRALALLDEESPALKQVETNARNVRNRLLQMNDGQRSGEGP